MTLLRPQTARQIAQYPASPVIYRRPVLSALFAAFYVGFAAMLVWLLGFPPSDPADRLAAGSGWYGLGMCVMLGGAYLIYSPPMVIDATHVHIRNPFRGVDIPLGHIKRVVPGSNFSVEAAYGRFYAWGVEAANFQVASGGYGTQGDVAALIEAASKRAVNSADPPARYQFRSPNLFFWAVAATYLGCAVYAANVH